MTLFGTGAVRSDKRLQLNIHLETWNEQKLYDRIGLGDESREILNSKIIIESAAMNYRLNQMGINTAKDFTSRLAEEIKRKNMNNGVE